MQEVIDLDAFNFAPIVENAARLVDLGREIQAWKRTVIGPAQQMGDEFLYRSYRQANSLCGHLVKAHVIGAHFWMAAGEDADSRIEGYRRFPDPKVRFILKSYRHESFVEDLFAMGKATQEWTNRFTMNQMKAELIDIADLTEAIAILLRRIEAELSKPAPTAPGAQVSQSEPNEANIKKLFPDQIPADPDIIDLVVRLDNARGTDVSYASIAREMTGETAGNDPKAKKLLARIRMLRKRGQLNLQ